jgi:hypothetical protein
LPPAAVPGDLPDVAICAWQAYAAMEASKAAHLAELTRLNAAQDAGRRRSLAEIAFLENLLERHSRCVRVFADAVKALATADPAAHRALLDRLTARNRAMGTTGASDRN